MPLRDSVDKIVTTYFAAVTTESFVYKGLAYLPVELTVSPLLFRGYTCPEHCGACCPRFSLDYLPGDPRTGVEVERLVEFNGRRVLLYSDVQEDHSNHHCRNLLDNGRCNIHGRHPFSCDFELIRFLHYGTSARLTAQLYGRAWNMLKVTRKRGTLCEMLPPDEHSVSEVLRKLARLEQWCTHFGLTTTRIPSIIEWVKTGPHRAPLTFPGEKSPTVSLPVVDPFNEE